MATANDIFNAAQTQITALQAIDTEIDAKISAIKNANPGVPLTAAQIKQVTTLRQQQTTVLNSMAELAYVTMTALDSAGDIAKLTAALGGVVANLNANTASITAIGGAAANIGNISTSISGLITQIKTLVPSKP